MPDRRAVTLGTHGTVCLGLGPRTLCRIRRAEPCRRVSSCSRPIIYRWLRIPCIGKGDVPMIG
ncbi:hypothetical protein DPMN_160687 [Dreissena polymorpha]|uniref:Uncharacterized protein n=1 Tax=Dreissena polymorpha TaxID=45954 RepID=A0A9D4IRX7_DREPO|nr:hypothetical protein DPMN_160687 [Dreissena polymorpha]